MGQAKQRGTFEQRRGQAIERWAEATEKRRLEDEKRMDLIARQMKARENGLAKQGKPRPMPPIVLLGMATLFAGLDNVRREHDQRMR